MNGIFILFIQVWILLKQVLLILAGNSLLRLSFLGVEQSGGNKFVVTVNRKSNFSSV